jgi:hypothetical protein
MAFPQVRSTIGGNQGNSTTPTINYPGTIVAGDLIVIFLATDGNPDSSGWPAGFTTPVKRSAASNAAALHIVQKVADGTESGSFTITLSANEATGHRAFALSGVDIATGIVVSTGATGTNANPNPDSLTSGFGAVDTLWFVAEANDGADDATGAPTNYGNLTTDGGTSDASACNCGTARRELNASSEDPGTFTLQGSEEWAAVTVAVPPAGAPASLLLDNPYRKSTLIRM